MVAVNQEPTHRVGLIRTLIKGLLFIIIKPIILLIFFIRHHPLPALIVLVALVGGVFWLGSNVASPLAPAVASNASGGARIAPELFLTGQKEANAALMWEAMSDDLKQGLQQNGQTPESMQQQLDNMRRQGVSYTSFQLIGSTPLNDGRSVYLYVVSASNGGQEPFTFTVNSSGKIERIE